MKKILFVNACVRACSRTLVLAKDYLTDSMDMSLSKLQELVMERKAVLQSMWSQRIGHNLVTEQQGD